MENDFLDLKLKLIFSETVSENTARVKAEGKSL